MAAPKDPRSVRLVRIAPIKNAVLDIWDVYTRASGIHLGDIRKLREARGGNPYVIGIGRLKVRGGFATRSATVEALLAAAREEVSEARS